MTKLCFLDLRVLVLHYPHPLHFPLLFFCTSSTTPLPHPFPISTPPSSLCCVVLTQSCLTLCGPVDCSLLGSSIHGIFQARILEWIAISFSGGSSQPRDQTCVSSVSCMLGRFFIMSASSLKF